MIFVQYNMFIQTEQQRWFKKISNKNYEVHDFCQDKQIPARTKIMKFIIFVYAQNECYEQNNKNSLKQIDNKNYKINDFC